MSDNVVIGIPKSIRACGHDEYWLQDQIAENPGVLQLGDLDVLSRERRQSSGGRLDMLLRNPEDDAMYEVEIMLGDTDETHIIRTIEYWDNEKRKWPNRQHYAVLVAESITRRFYNVVQLLSHAIPIIAVQVNIVEAEGKRILHFSKILDTYEEPEDENGAEEGHDEDYWIKKAPWTVETAKALLEVARPVFGECELNYVKHYIGISVHNYNYLWMHKRSAGKSLVGFWFTDAHLVDAQKIFDDAQLPYVKKKDQLMITADKATIVKHKDALKAAAVLVKQSWEE